MKTMVSLKSERFEIAFNRIHLELKRLVRNETPQFRNLVYRGAKRLTLIKTYQEELHQFARLRNAIVHNKYDLGQYIAEPHEDTVQRIEAICKIFTRPNQAMSFATKDVVTYNYGDSIEKVFQGTLESSYSQYPIYDNGVCVGLLTAKAIVRWAAENTMHNRLDFSGVLIGDVFNAEDHHPIEFVSQTANIFDVEEIFGNAHIKKQDLEAVVITEHGRKDERPLGIITPRDLMEVDYVVG